MLSEAAVNYLQPLKHNPDAQRHCSMIPLGGIYWDDEIPEFSKLMTVPKDDRDAIFRLFSIRFKLWAGDELDADDQAYWDAALEVTKNNRTRTPKTKTHIESARSVRTLKWKALFRLTQCFRNVLLSGQFSNNDCIVYCFAVYPNSF